MDNTKNMFLDDTKQVSQAMTWWKNLPSDAQGHVFILLEFLFHLSCSWWSVHIFPFARAFVGPVSHLQTLLAAHMLFVRLSARHKIDNAERSGKTRLNSDVTTVKRQIPATVVAVQFFIDDRVTYFLNIRNQNF